MHNQAVTGSVAPENAQPDDTGHRPCFLAHLSSTTRPGSSPHASLASTGHLPGDGGLNCEQLDRCPLYFAAGDTDPSTGPMRNVLAKVPKASAQTVAAAVRTIFAQPDAAHVRSQLAEVTTMLSPQFPEVAAMLEGAAEDLLAFCGFPQPHWRKIWSTNPLERAFARQ